MSVYVVTGAAGHLGTALLRHLLDHGERVRALTLPGETLNLPQAYGDGLSCRNADVTDRVSLDTALADLHGEDLTVIHAAGLTSIGDVPVARLRAVNVGGTANVLAACRAAGVRRLVYVSSVHAIPEPDDPTTVITELEAPNDFDSNRVVGDYARTKAEATRELLLAARRGGPEVVVVHPSGFLGPWDEGGNHLVDLIDRTRQRRVVLLVRGGFDIVDVRDVASGTVAAAQIGRAGECYILSGTYADLATVVAPVCERTGVRVLPSLPRKVAAALAPAAELLGRVTRSRPLFTRFAVRTLGAPSCFSHAKATAELGYEPRPLRQTVLDTLDWLERENRGIGAD